MNQYRNEHNRHPNYNRHPEHRHHSKHDIDRSEEENYGNMAGSLSFGYDDQYGPTRSEYERYGYLDSQRDHPAHQHSTNESNMHRYRNYYDDANQHYEQNLYHARRSYSPGYDALGQAYGWEERPHEHLQHNNRVNQDRDNQYNQRRNYDYSQSEHYESRRAHNLGSHDYDNYHLSGRGERSHRGRYTNPGEYYW